MIFPELLLAVKKRLRSGERLPDIAKAVGLSLDEVNNIAACARKSRIEPTSKSTAMRTAKPTIGRCGRCMQNVELPCIRCRTVAIMGKRTPDPNEPIEELQYELQPAERERYEAILQRKREEELAIVEQSKLDEHDDSEEPSDTLAERLRRDLSRSRPARIAVLGVAGCAIVEPTAGPDVVSGSPSTAATLGATPPDGEQRSE